MESGNGGCVRRPPAEERARDGVVVNDIHVLHGGITMQDMTKLGVGFR